MMQHSRVSLWWVLLHFVAASPAMQLGMVRPQGRFEAFETYPHCLTAGATFSHVQSISITPSRYIEQATVLFYQGKHDRAKQALQLRHNETNSLCWCAMQHEWFTKQDDDYQVVISTCFSPFLIAIPDKLLNLLMMINLSSLLLVINLGHWSLVTKFPNDPQWLLW